MNIDCKALDALLVAGIAVAGMPAVASAAVAAPAPPPAIALGSIGITGITGTTGTADAAADLLGPATRVPPWNLPTPSYPLPWPWPRPRLISLTVSATPGNSPTRPTPPACGSLPVTVDGPNSPNSLDSGDALYLAGPAYGTSQSKRCVWIPK